jgi:uncharacterized protein (UPF0333 family)
MRFARLRSSRGQSTVEVAALVPLVVLVAFAAYALLATLRAQDAAHHAAANGARAVLQARDGATAARESLPERDRRHATIHARDGRVTVIVRPRLPLSLGGRLAVRAIAEAGEAR